MLEYRQCAISTSSSSSSSTISSFLFSFQFPLPAPKFCWNSNSSSISIDSPVCAQMTKRFDCYLRSAERRRSNSSKNDARNDDVIDWFRRSNRPTTTTTHPTWLYALNSCVVILAAAPPQGKRRRRKPLFSLSFFLLNIYVCFEAFFFIFYFLVMFSPNRAETLIFAEIVRRPHYRTTWPTRRMSWSRRNESRPKASLRKYNKGVDCSRWGIYFLGERIIRAHLVKSRITFW